MLHPIINSSFGLPLFVSGNKEDEVDKGTNRKTPGNSEGAKPPSKKDYEEIKRENDQEKEIQQKKSENQKEDKNRN
jgi:hypothetical protein